MGEYSKIYIGIDPGVKTGICIIAGKTIYSIDCLPIHKAMEKVKEVINIGDVFVRLEDARLRKWVPYQKNEKAERGRAAGAGSVKRDAKIWEDYLTELGIPFELVAPKANKTKVTAEYFKKLTGYQGKTNEHLRDAAMLVVGH